VCLKELTLCYALAVEMLFVIGGTKKIIRDSVRDLALIACCIT
jgi:hypothetical protein